MLKETTINTYSLRDSPFFRLRSRKKLAQLLRVSPKTLSEISQREDLYSRCWKSKKGDVWLKSPPDEVGADKYRPIDIPDHRLKSLQARIANLLSRITPPEWLFSPVKGRSYVDNAAYHKGAKAYWLLDIENFFPSCSGNNVAHFFSSKLECSPDVTAILIHITTILDTDTDRVGLPQGSPCSPILAFFSNLDMWAEVESIVKKASLKHGVYADDITISGDMVPKAAIWEIKKAIHKHGHKIKAAKEVSLIHAPADITGVIVTEGKTKLPNRQWKKLNELLAARSVAKGSKLRQRLDNQISGRIAQKNQVERS
ncbi:MAG: hypothetical protein COB39_10380 [Marinosulfonomonas sp.]|nr:MAG: hypothetical protein COB39_10380 [Marinosulfonomonas sp.]